jgi:hypothetical protein
MNTVMDELVSATSVKRKARENENAWKKRIVEAVSDLDEDDFGKLSEFAQVWSNNQIKMLKANSKAKLEDWPVAGPEDPDEEEEEEEEAADDDEDDGSNKEKEVDQPAAKKQAKGKPALKKSAKPAEKKGTKPAEKKEKKKLSDWENTAWTACKRLIIKNQKLTANDLTEKFEKLKDTNLKYLQSVRADTIHTMRVLNKLGMLKDGALTI